LIVEIEKSKDIKEIINITKSTISGVSAVNAPDDKTSVDKKEVLEKLNQFLTELESMDGGSQEEDSDDESDDSAEEKPLALGAGEKLPSINLDVMKLNPAQALKYLPEYQKAVEFSQKSLATVKSGLLRTEVTQGVNVSDEESSEFKKKYRECAIFYHPDKITVSGLTKEEADELFKKVKECYTKKDFKTLQKMYDNISKIKSAKETLDKFNKIKSDLEKKSKETPENEPDPNNPNKKAIGSGEVKKTEAPVEKNERRVSSYIGFVLEKQDDDLLKGEDSEISKKVKVVFDKIFTEEFMVKYQVKEQDASKFKDDGNREITIDPILEIVKIFNRAYKIHTPGNIPSGRKGGKISNRVFREYEYVGEGNDDARNAEDGGISPGIGPYRNRAVFNKWENAVLDILNIKRYLTKRQYLNLVRLMQELIR
jgi:cell fate (sporulation/competence/biofilm development) regulator YlbF (YheA/YmcA/DUF963 family)